MLKVYVQNNPVNYYDSEGLTSVRAGTNVYRLTVPNSGNWSQGWMNSYANYLRNEIHRIDPVAPTGSFRGPNNPYRRSDITYLQAMLFRAQNAGFCGPGASARTPVGRSGQNDVFKNPLSPFPRNNPELINGRFFTGHSIDRMQQRGFTPSVVEGAIRNGTRSLGNTPNTSVFTDTANNLRVIVNTNTGAIVTVIPGAR
ncbi:MAG: DUF4258 domain-containing protein [Pseudomonadota bacterium]